jgi:23S rRNA (cytosine1962-C5)-methyltransferase
VYAEAIRQQSFVGQAGDLAVIFDSKHRFMAVGLFDPFSPIRLRILQANTPQTVDHHWLRGKVETAVAIRQPLLSTHTTGYRVLHGENDGLPGLVLDRYESTYVLKLYTAAWIPHLPMILDVLKAVLAPEQVVLRLSRFSQRYPELLHGLTDGTPILGPLPSAPVLFWENGLRFEADVLLGQKTGFFLDQRDNRARVGALAAGKRVLNVFAYTGGFSLYAARGGSPRVISIDLSQPALAGASRNFRLNREIAAVAACDHEILVGDAFQALRRVRETRRKFDVVVIDPPAFAKKQEELERALTAYGRLVRLGLGVLNDGGTLVMASCSSRVTTDAFFETIHQAALRSGRPLRELERTGHALDHPISYPEGAYLKCLFAQA